MSILPRLFLLLGLSLLLIACRADKPRALVADAVTPTQIAGASATWPTAQLDPTNLLAARQEADFTALPAPLQQSLQTFFDAQRATLNAQQTQPVTVALVPKRVALVGDWALVLLAYENAYTDGIVRAEPLTARQLGARYLHRQSTTDSTAPWRVAQPDAVPGAMQAALWGAQTEKCLPSLCVRYRPFGLPAIEKSLR